MHFLRDLAVLVLESECRNGSRDSLASYRSRVRFTVLIIFLFPKIFCICFDGVVIAAQCTATFSDLLCSPEFSYY